MLPQEQGVAYDITGKPVRLGAQIGKGGEGAVFALQSDPALAAKFYHSDFDNLRVQKLELMCRLRTASLDSVAAWPMSVLRSSKGGGVNGLIMRRIIGSQEVHQLYSPKSRRTAFPEAQFPFILHTATNVARAFAAVHATGQVIGDVNHGNLLVSQAGTVSMIDCDSFQVQQGSHLFVCPVGVPTYTAPELQGKVLASVKRTEQHDAFGLAVLIFHLMFMGRHPFAGIFLHGKGDKTIEEAIGECRFPYLGDYEQTQMEPPPNALRLIEVPPSTVTLFKNAFMRSGTNGTRPHATEWITNLQAVSKQLRQCSANTSHQYFGHSTSCPWCRIEGITGTPLFGIKLARINEIAFNLELAWGAIESIAVPRSEPFLPTAAFYKMMTQISSSIEGVRVRRRQMRMIGLAAVFTAVAIVYILSFTALTAVMLLAVGLGVGRTFWVKGTGIALPLRTEREEAQKAFDLEMQEWERLGLAPRSFAQIRDALAVTKRDYEGLKRVKENGIMALEASLRQKQLQHFLESHRIEDAVITNIGSGRKVLLSANSVEDAFDVTEAALKRIKGIGPTMRSNLLSWREGIERHFRFDATKGIDPRDVIKLEQELNLKRSEYIRKLQSGPEQLRNALNMWQSQKQQILGRMDAAARRLAEAEVNLAALGRV